MRILTFLAVCLAAACAPSPLYVSRARLGTPGEVPRDSRGQPMWNKIPAPPPPEKPAPPIAVHPGPPIENPGPNGR